MSRGRKKTETPRSATIQTKVSLETLEQFAAINSKKGQSLSAAFNEPILEYIEKNRDLLD